MNKKYVTSSQLSRQLKEAGLQQKSEWYWAVEMEKGKETDRWSLCPSEHLLPEHPKYSAFHVGELGDMLPVNTIRDWWIKQAVDGSRYYEMVTDYEKVTDISLAEAMGKMLLYLKKEGLL